MALPYDDEFENNNPFAEPEDTQPLAAPSMAPQPEQPASEPVVDQPAPQAEPQAPTGAPDLVAEPMLRKLVPERFAKYLLKFKITAVERNKPGNPIVKFSVAVQGLPKFRLKVYKDVRRTYSEVVKFNKYLTVLNLELFVPVFPLALTLARMEDEPRQLQLVWQEWFDRISSNPIIIRDEEFVYFIENDFGYAVINLNRKQLVASGFVRKTLKQLAPPYDPVEPLATFRPQVKGAYLGLQKLHKQCERRLRAEKQVLIHMYDLANKFGLMAAGETTHPGMRNLWEKLAGVANKQLDYMLADSTNEMATLGDGALNVSNDCYEIKEALTNRHLIMRELDKAAGHLEAKEAYAAKMKLKTTLDPLKVDEAIRAVEHATQVRDLLELQVQRILAEMLCERQEVIDFADHKVKQLLKAYTLRKVAHHRQLLKHLEAIRLDVRLVDAKGGLSRLNRDNLSLLKHNLPQSQDAEGDAWLSRTFRLLQTDEPPKRTPETKLNARNAAALLGVATFT